MMPLKNVAHELSIYKDLYDHSMYYCTVQKVDTDSAIKLEEMAALAENSHSNKSS